MAKNKKGVKKHKKSKKKIHAVKSKKPKQASRKARKKSGKKIAIRNRKRKISRAKTLTRKLDSKTTKQNKKGISKKPKNKKRKSTTNVTKTSNNKQKIIVTKLKRKDNPRYYSNLLLVKLPARSTVQQKILLIDQLQSKDIKYYVDKNYPLFPRGYQIIIQTSKGKETFEKANKFVTDKGINIDNIKQSIKDAIVEYQDSYFFVLEEAGEKTLGDSDWVFNPKNITAIYIRFFY